MSSTFKKYLMAPRVPSNAASFLDGAFAVVSLVRTRGAFSLTTTALTQLPEDVLVPRFDSQNVLAEEELRTIIRQTIEAAGLSNKKRWSVALPEGVARTMVISLETKPSGNRELSEMISWKVERVVTAPSSELRITRQRISPLGGEERYLVSVAVEMVMREYEALFGGFGWHAGLLLPRHVGEAQWLVWDASTGDKMLVSDNSAGLTAVISQRGEPTLVRAIACEADSKLDELYRLAVYYRDRMAEGEGALERTLILGDLDPAQARDVIADAVGKDVELMDPTEFGFDLRGEPLRFDELAAAAGLASMAWQ